MDKYDRFFDREYAQSLYEEHVFSPSAEEIYQDPIIFRAAVLHWICSLTGVTGIRFEQTARLLLWWKGFQDGEEFGETWRKAPSSCTAGINAAWREILLTPRRQANPALCTLILKRIDRQYASLTLRGLAQQLNLNSTYLSRVISRDIKCSFPELIQCHRIMAAVSQLPVPRQKLSLEKLADTLGYSSPHYFYCVFKEYTGITPAQARVVITMLAREEQENAAAPAPS